MDKTYYEAYDARYRRVHAEGLQWTSDIPTPIVAKTLEKRVKNPDARILEIGCGEGRDARALLARGVNLLATDVSPEAIAHCRRRDPAHAARYRTLDCVTGTLNMRFDLIYAVAVLHMLVEDAHRRAFYRFVREHLADGGVALICTMGDGVCERCGDVCAAFAPEERVHQPSGRTLTLPTLPARVVSFATLRRELACAGLTPLELKMTGAEPEFDRLMAALVVKDAEAPAAERKNAP